MMTEAERMAIVNNFFFFLLLLLLMLLLMLLLIQMRLFYTYTYRLWDFFFMILACWTRAAGRLRRVTTEYVLEL